MSLRLCQAFLPLIKRFTKPEEVTAPAPQAKSGSAEPQTTEQARSSSAGLLHEAPKTPEELISLLEKIQKDA